MPRAPVRLHTLNQITHSCVFRGLGCAALPLQELVIPLREFKAIKIDYERRSREKKLTDTT